MSGSLYNLALQNYKHLAIFFTADLALLRHCFIIGTTNFAGHPPVCNREVGGAVYASSHGVFSIMPSIPDITFIVIGDIFFCFCAALWELKLKGGSVLFCQAYSSSLFLTH
ncbi:hypothetical protein [Plesiomonas shigelloides]|uniref:hypothetical protein n=1 Tax=Plesiomonas shigelloides TaxID=703 RepID=UPI00131AEF87|nr:hypothetical protein [Plesiomonas shigelloides]